MESLEIWSEGIFPKIRKMKSYVIRWDIVAGYYFRSYFVNIWHIECKGTSVNMVSGY